MNEVWTRGEISAAPKDGSLFSMIANAPELAHAAVAERGNFVANVAAAQDAGRSIS